MTASRDNKTFLQARREKDLNFWNHVVPYLVPFEDEVKKNPNLDTSHEELDYNGNKTLKRKRKIEITQSDHQCAKKIKALNMTSEKTENKYCLNRTNHDSGKKGDNLKLLSGNKIPKTKTEVKTEPKPNIVGAQRQCLKFNTKPCYVLLKRFDVKEKPQNRLELREPIENGLEPDSSVNRGPSENKSDRRLSRGNKLESDSDVSSGSFQKRRKPRVIEGVNQSNSDSSTNSFRDQSEASSPMDNLLLYNPDSKRDPESAENGLQTAYLPVNKNKLEMNPKVFLGKIEDCVSFLKGFHLRPAWRNSNLFKSPEKLKKLGKFRRNV